MHSTPLDLVPTRIIKFPPIKHIALRNEVMYNGMRDFPFPLIPFPDCGTAQCALGPELISIKEITHEPYETVNLNRNFGEISAFNTEDISIPTESGNKKGQNIHN
jgi:hypothetical protein